MKKQIKTAYNALVEEYHDLRKQDTSVKFYKEVLETPVMMKLTGNVRRLFLLGYRLNNIYEMSTNEVKLILGGLR